MKKYIAIFLSAFALSACTSILEPDPLTSLDASVALVDGGSANGALRGVYSRMQDDYYYGMEYVLNNDLVADNAIFQGFFDSQLEMNQRAVPIANLFVNQVWWRIYRVINLTNELITNVPDIEDPLFNNQDLVIGQSKAVRAMAYFDLLRYFGEHFDQNSPHGVPILLDPIADNDFNNIPRLGRSSVNDVYTQVFSDINDALDLLSPGAVDRGRMNYWAVLALRARVNLYLGNYDQAFADADAVIEEGPFQLVEDLFDLYETETTVESIFEVEFNDQDQSAFNSFLIRRDEYNVDPSLLEAFEEGDIRRGLYGVERNRDRCFKYPDPTNANNAKVLRLAEMYFIRSEASAMLFGPNEGLDDLNVIRVRAGLEPLAPFTSMDQYVQALLQERRIELSFEGHRFFDLVRFDRIGAVLGMEPFRKVFPIPRDELIQDEEGLMVQNPGYEAVN